MDSFFNKTILDIYREKIKTVLTEKRVWLLNLSELKDYLKISRLDLIKYDLRKTQKRKQKTQQEYQENINAIIQKLANTKCKDIGIDYGKSAVHSSFDEQKNIEILVLIDHNYKYLRLQEDSLIQQRLDMIYGFIIVEKGECKYRPNVYTVNLICSQMKGGGSVLLGAYLYMIKRNTQIQQMGLLELAGGFTNVVGLCAYSKFGFLPNITYLGADCFSDTGNLPMSVDLDEIESDEIINVVLGKKNIKLELEEGIDEDDEYNILQNNAVCDKTIDPKTQSNMAFYLNALYRAIYNNELKEQDYRQATTEYEKNDILEKIKRMRTFITQYIRYIQTISPPPPKILDNQLQKLEEKYTKMSPHESDSDSDSESTPYNPSDKITQKKLSHTIQKKKTAKKRRTTKFTAATMKKKAAKTEFRRKLAKSKRLQYTKNS